MHWIYGILSITPEWTIAYTKTPLFTVHFYIMCILEPLLMNSELKTFKILPNVLEISHISLHMFLYIIQPV